MTEPFRSGQASDGPSRGSLRDDPARSEAARKAAWRAQHRGPITVKQYEALVALATTGSYDLAAASIGITKTAFHHRIASAYVRLGVSNEGKGSSIRAFRQLGWLRVPGEAQFRNIVRVLLGGAS